MHAYIFIWVLVYGSTHVNLHFFMCRHACMHIEAIGNLRCHSRTLSILVLRQSLSLFWNSPIRLDWLASEPQRSPISTSSALATMPGSFYMGSGDQTHVLIFVTEALLLTETSHQPGGNLLERVRYVNLSLQTALLGSKFCPLLSPNG